MFDDFTLWILVSFFLALFVLIIYALRNEDKAEKELKQNLEDECLIDPDTGIRMTLEQAQDGSWEELKNKEITKSEVDSMLSERERHQIQSLNYIRTSESYKRIELTHDDLIKLRNTKILSKYSQWNYSNSYSFKKGALLFPSPTLARNYKGLDNYSENQIMFWIKINDIRGHYYLREKLIVDKIIDQFKNNDDLKLTSFESFTIIQSNYASRINRILKYFEGIRWVEIEFWNEDLFIKTTRQAWKKDIIALENLITKI